MALDKQLVEVSKKRLSPYKYLCACDEIIAASRKGGRLVTQNRFCLHICVWGVIYINDNEDSEDHIPIPQKHVIANISSRHLKFKFHWN